MRVIMTGSRDYTDEANIRRHIEQLSRWYCVDADHPLVIVHGCARGADTIVNNVCLEMGIKVDRNPVSSLEWKHFPHTAGRMRNERMLDKGADMVIGFKDDPDPTLETGGTEHMIKIAREAGILSFFALRPV